MNIYNGLRKQFVQQKVIFPPFNRIASGPDIRRKATLHRHPSGKRSTGGDANVSGLATKQRVDRRKIAASSPVCRCPKRLRSKLRHLRRPVTNWTGFSCQLCPLQSAILGDNHRRAELWRPLRRRTVVEFSGLRTQRPSSPDQPMGHVNGPLRPLRSRSPDSSTA
jgi:hypothetical protein